MKIHIAAAQWVLAEIDLSALKKVREEDQARNYQDWDGQHRFQEVKLEPAQAIGSLPRLIGNL